MTSATSTASTAGRPASSRSGSVRSRGSSGPRAGGATWTESFVNPDPNGFLDALAFWDADRGLALGDPVDGRFVILATADGGRTWSKLPPDGMPKALPGEGAFAASGTSLAVGDDGLAWFGTGGASTARVFRSTDRGRTWSAAPVPIRSGTASSGVFSVAFRDASHGVAVGGDYKLPDEAAGTAAITRDGGRTWRAVRGPGLSGFRSAVSFVPGAPGPRLVAVGPSGADWSDDGGETWARFGAEGFHALAVSRDGRSAWAVGDRGRIARLDPSALGPSPGPGQGRSPGSGPPTIGVSAAFPQSDQPR